MILQKHIVRMTLEEKCAQMVFPEHRFDVPDPEAAVRLAKSGVGGFCLFQGDRFEVTPFLNSLQNLAKYPLLFCADFENGVGQQVKGATELPSNLAVGATGSEELARLKGRVTGVEAVALGVPWVLAPVVDLQSNPLNPVIATRAFGEEVAAVSRLAGAFAAGLREAGALSCAKHFPGHGDVAVDSHIDLPVVEGDATRLREGELKPYATLRDSVDSVMVGHLRVPAFDADRPSSLSRKITHDLLRGEIGFGGLVCTDALMMGGVTRVMSEDDALIEAALAGADALLYPVTADRAARVLVEAVRSGRIPEKRIDDAVGYLFALKEKTKLFEQKIADPNRLEERVGCEEHREAARRIAEAAVTLVRDGRNLLPLKGRVGLQWIDEDQTGDGAAFREELAKYVEVESGKPGGGRPVVTALFFRPQAFLGRAGLEESTVNRMREQLCRVPETIVVSFGSPYVIRQLPEVESYVCAYGADEASQRAAARALAGVIPFRGSLPVRLNA